VVGHDHECVQLIVFEGAGVVMNRFDYHVGDCGLPKIQSASASVIQKSIHGDESAPRIHCFRRKAAVRREAVVESPSEEDRSADFV
jgi:hypothetical protein